MTPHSVCVHYLFVILFLGVIVQLLDENVTGEAAAFF